MSGKRPSANNNAHNRQKQCKVRELCGKVVNTFAVCLDLESLVVPVATAENNPTISSTSTLEQNLPCSYCMIVIERDNNEPMPS